VSFDRKYLVWALGYVTFGMCLGIYMAASHNHAQHVTHAHINLVGFVLSLGYGLIHKLWLGHHSPVIARIQFIVHHAAALTLFAGLLLLYGNVFPEAQLDPILAIASVSILLSALLMMYMVLKPSAVKA